MSDTPHSSTIIDRLREVMQQYDLTPSGFAEEIGVQRSGISHILSGRNKPSLDFIDKLLTRFPEVDANWLILGQGNSGDLARPAPPKDVVAKPAVAGRTIDKVMIFYSDQTVEVFREVPVSHRD